MNRLLGLFLFFVAAFSIALLLGAAYPGVTFIEALIGVGSFILGICLIGLAVMGIALMFGACD